MTTAQAKVAQLYADFKAGDLPAVVRGMDPNITWISHAPTTAGQVFRGHAGAEHYLTKEVAEKWDFTRFEVTKTVASGADVVVFVDIEGTWKPSGLVYSGTLVHEWVVGDAGPTSYTEHVDSLAMAKVMKLV